MTLITTLVASIVGSYSKAGDLGGPSANVQLVHSATWPSGTADGQADKVWGDERTLAASATEDLDLNAVLLDAFGDLFSPAEIVAVLITADAGNTNNVIVGGAAATQFVGPFGAATHTHAVRPGGWYGWSAPGGFAVGAGTDLLRIANGGAGTSVTYKILIVARSA